MTQPSAAASGAKANSPVPSQKSEPKQSKLAMKSKFARAKTSTEPEPELEENVSVIEVPMFSPSAIRSRALPSAFATLLVSDEPDAAAANGQDGSYLCQHHQHQRERTRSSDRSNSVTSRSHRHKEKDIPRLPSGPLPSLRGFAFDVPSPDDVVFNARTGTSLAQRTTSSTQSALSASAR